MNAEAFESHLRDLVEAAAAAEDGTAGELELEAALFYAARVSTYAEAGLLTSNRGLVVRMSDGSEFQVTIVRSR